MPINIRHLNSIKTYDIPSHSKDFIVKYGNVQNGFFIEDIKTLKLTNLYWNFKNLNAKNNVKSQLENNANDTQKKQKQKLSDLQGDGIFGQIRRNVTQTATRTVDDSTRRRTRTRGRTNVGSERRVDGDDDQR
jgi:hypothetical protein